MREALRNHAASPTPAAPSGDAASASAARFAVRRLALSDFRGYGSLRIEADPRPVVLTGPNGAGKTNLIEALSFLAPGRGLRRARLDEVDRRQTGDAARWAVAASLATPKGPIEIGTGRDPEAPVGTLRRVVRLDGKTLRSQAELARLLSVLWVTPDMDRLFQEGSSARRRFLDRMVYGVDPDHAGYVAAYDHALRERARLLAEGSRDAAWLSALEATMAAKGVAIAAGRRGLVRRLESALRLGVAPFPRAEIALLGTLEAWLDEMPALAVEEKFKEALEAARAEDALEGGAREGAHRSDLAVRHVEADMPAALCSTGEQKALLVALVLAQARLQASLHAAPPLLLLDEVGAHLDRVRRAALYDELVALGAQAWMTGTDEALFESLGARAQYFRVVDGNVVAR
ncbi:MAG TPA: DNA replication/repair protein RecF [Alphaproteobacteria bacterium]|nr:DNA replication/repair protein RecF [Alphaproteobacteria bacterium]